MRDMRTRNILGYNCRFVSLLSHTAVIYIVALSIQETYRQLPEIQSRAYGEPCLNSSQTNLDPISGAVRKPFLVIQSYNCSRGALRQYPAAPAHSTYIHALESLIVAFLIKYRTVLQSLAKPASPFNSLLTWAPCLI
jgi:hypothetical protein